MQINGIGVNSILHGGAPKLDPMSGFDREFDTFGKLPKIAPTDMSNVEGPSFMEVLHGAINEVQHTKNEAEQISFDYATGKPIDVHTMMIAVAKADIAMQLTSAVVSKTATSVNQLLQTQI
ncbi:MAG: flagellar hook-basal body complex protein FliE [Cyanobacteria bacterium RYN_339]|nr:flagellar hook-basal body complex protein FliE [Cyanobacteria bacterium RYN_339]